MGYDRAYWERRQRVYNVHVVAKAETREQRVVKILAAAMYRVSATCVPSLVLA